MITSADLELAVRGRAAPWHFARTAAGRADKVALRWMDSDGFRELSWRQYADRACRLSASLRELGIGPGHRVLLMMTNRPEFHVADTAIMLAGATPVSIYNSSAPEQVAYVAGHSEASAAIVGDVGFLERVQKVRSALPGLRHVAVIDDPERTADRDVLRWDALLEAAPENLERAAERCRPEDLLTLIYTSGTTGLPKGVMLTHKNICWLLESWARAMGEGGSMAGWRMVSYLPMAHIAERLFSHYLHLAHGSVVTTCPDPAEVGSHLLVTQPHCFFGPPRIWEKFHAGMWHTAPDRCAAVSEASADDMRAIRAIVGLQDCRMALTGAAPMHPGVHRFMLDIGIPLSEIYGLSECTGPMTWSPHGVRPGTVGPPIPGQEVTIAADGEVLARGGNVFSGYLKDPERTAEMLDADGWLHTGDVGAFADGYLRIVDRKKELIITAGGKNISPANLEAALKSFPLIGQACAVGDRRPYVTALLVLDPEAVRDWALKQGMAHLDLAALAAAPDLRSELERNVAEANQRFSRAEQIKAFAVLGEEWLPDSTELTPTMKLKRRPIQEKYAAQIEALYSHL